ncbi:hypothetical protein WH87_00375 [Devosia epidermidihirudinis]|uniref:DUF937 domain-containing protein n=1 Tax=Devosia epidermidihirudinis TaxID=1293439 RepID=A0A0F5QKF4_9HYPH|nr:YidB family protein [Devosia epidermidihirudinis]KKC41445.1 hypothetical protein WH87_00375 [Devosia epidermidihirudinis]
MANRGMPSLLALLGLVAVAGYQNRDKISQALGSAGGSNPAGNAGNALGEAGNIVGRTAGSIGESLTGGLNDLLATFRDTGHKEQADSWITPGVPTQGLSRSQVENAIGRDTLLDVAQKSGLQYDDLLERLSVSIPNAVDRLTPDGRFPESDEDVQKRMVGQ